MNELDEMREKVTCVIQRVLPRDRKVKYSLPRTLEGQVDEILSLQTDTLRIAVVRKEAQLPSVTWTVSSYVPVATELEIGSAFLKVYKDAGFVQEEKSDNR